MLLLQGKPGTDSWLADRYGRVLERCAQDVLGPTHVKVAFAGDPAAAGPRRAQPAPGRTAHTAPA